MLPKNFTGAIHSANFPEVWADVIKRLTSAKKKYLIEKIIIPLGNITFLISCLIVFYGYLYEMNQEILHNFLLEIPALPKIWETISPLFVYPNLPLALQIVLPILILYLIPLALSGFVFGLVWFLYRPKSIPVMVDNAAEDSRTLHNLAIELLTRKKRIRPGAYFWFNIVFIVLSSSLLAYFLFSALISGQLMEVFESIGQAPVTDVIITLIAPIIAYGILNFPFGYLLMLFYYFRVPASLTVETEAYFFTCNPEEKVRFEEENTILEKAREIKARRKKEALFTKK